MERESKLLTVKYLGVIQDQKLNFSKHTECIRSKCVGRLRMLGWTCRFVDQETLLRLYKSLIVPVMDYNDVVYDCLSARDTYKIHKI